MVLCSIGAFAQEDDSPLRYVNPFIGTGGHGHTYPGASVPFGMVQLSPDAGKSGWDWCSGYHYGDSTLAGFSHTHLSGTGCGDLGDIQFMPGTSARILNDGYRARFSHERETATPGYYEVYLRDSGIDVELTATTRAGFHRYTFPPADSALLVVNLGYGQDDIPVECQAGIENGSLLMGYRFSNGWAADQRVYFAARFSPTPVAVQYVADGALIGQGRIARGRIVKALLRFDLPRGGLILAAVGISSVNASAALVNLTSEIPSWDFDIIRQSTAESWDHELRKIMVQTADERAKTVFYTALYHALLAPTIYSDLDRRYRGADGQIHTGSHFDDFSTLSLWDTFRAAHPLYTILEPSRVDDMVNAMLAFARESGHLPVWPLAACETNTMIGYNAVPVIADALFKGIKGFDIQEAYRAMKASAIRDHRGLKYYTPSAAVFPSDNASSGPWPAGDLGTVVSGFAARLSGDTITYHSAHPQVSRALIARASAEQSTMRWITPPVTTRAGEKFVTFVWLAGIASGKGGHRFDLSMNHQYLLSVATARAPGQKEWDVNGRTGARLSFRTSFTDWMGDLFGTMILSVPSPVLKQGVGQELQVTGEGAQSQDWMMAFMHTITPRMVLSPEFGTIKEGGATWQVVRADIERLAPPKRSTLATEGAASLNPWLSPGLTTVRIRIPAVSATRTLAVTLGSPKQPDARGSATVMPMRSLGYIPGDREPESVSQTLEYAYDDWCIAQVAKALGNKEDEALFTERAGYYKNIFDRSTGFMRGRNADGSWRSPFNPRYATGKQPEYTEGNAWQYTWFVPHDVKGLIALMGGREKFSDKLDSLFHQSSDLEGTGAPSDVSGLIGLYAHGNEPSHHIAYLYDYCGKPWKTQELVRKICRELYGSGPDGLCGNEDCGQMSAWYVLTAMGLYPVNPAEGVYVIGSPSLESAAIGVGEGKTFTITAQNLSAQNVYIQSVRLNGQPLEKTFIRHADLMEGGTLEFTMGPAPNTKWGSSPSAAPPSMSP
jgi:putative alpha-1,2-mannosidase